MIFGITGNIYNEATKEIVITSLTKLDKKSVTYLIEDELAKVLKLPENSTKSRELGKKSDLIIAFGGDGTLLSVAKQNRFSNTPILGVNAGHLGFLTEIPPENLSERINDLLAGNYDVENRNMIEAAINGNNESLYYAVNDIVIDKGGFPRSLKASLSIENEFCHLYSSDGIIISTATGSTAYSLSAGGPIIYPTNENILITPICPHTLSARPMIIPESFHIEIEIVSGPEEVFLNADGRPAASLVIGDKISIRRSKFSLNLVHFKGHSFFRVLRTKLDWGTQADIK